MILLEYIEVHSTLLIVLYTLSNHQKVIRDQEEKITNLPFVKAEFSGRTFLRSDYTTNMLFDDISDDFTGIGKTYSLTVGGANTASGISTGNGVVIHKWYIPNTINYKQ